MPARYRILCAILAMSACTSHAPMADLILSGGRVWTGVPEAPWAEAVAVAGDRILAVGSRAEIERHAGPDSRRIDATGGMVVPGFIDAHVHFLAGGFQLSRVQLRDAATPDQFRDRIATFAATLPAGAWVLGGNWDHELWGGDLPRRDWIDGSTPDHPVFVSRLDGHMALANSAALAAAGITAATNDIEGGEIVRDPDGSPTGILKDNAMALVTEVIPRPSTAEVRAALDAAQQYVLAQGVTTIHHMGTWEDLEAFASARADGDLQVRVHACVPLEAWQRLADRVAAQGRGDIWLRADCLKGFVDGSLGSHTAAFLEPFTDAPEDRGLLVNDPDDLYRWVHGADRAGLRVMVHAIGDRAIRTLLDIYERVGRDDGPRDRRFRIEHAQHIDPADLPRFAGLGIIASMQPYHAIDDGRWAERVIGATRAHTTYAFRSLLDAGAVLAFGSDWTVAPATPIEGIYAAVTRRTLDGAHPEGWVPEQKISVQEALAAYTAGGAFAGFEEQIKGTVQAGKLADLVVIDRDLSAIAPERIRQARVLATLVGGRVRFRAARLR